MSEKNISRNALCPCGSGKKFKACCIDKGIDWQARQPAKLRLPTPRRAAPPPANIFLGPFDVINARLNEIARAIPGNAAWKSIVERLSEATPEAERFAAYRAIREANVLSEDVVLFLFSHAVQWFPSAEDDLDRHIVATLRRHGLEDIADLYTRDRLGHNRRYERGRQFFMGPPDEELAARLREMGVID